MWTNLLTFTLRRSAHNRNYFDILLINPFVHSIFGSKPSLKRTFLVYIELRLKIAMLSRWFILRLPQASVINPCPLGDVWPWDLTPTRLYRFCLFTCISLDNQAVRIIMKIGLVMFYRHRSDLEFLQVWWTVVHSRSPHCLECIFEYKFIINHKVIAYIQFMSATPII